jgi:hypothetical protein
MLRAAEDPLSAEERQAGQDRFLAADKEHAGSVRESVKAAMREHAPLPGQPDTDMVRDIAGKNHQERKQNLSGQPRHEPYSNPDSRPARIRRSFEHAFAVAEANAEGRFSDAQQRGMHRGQQEMAQVAAKVPRQYHAELGKGITALRDLAAKEAHHGQRSGLPDKAKSMIGYDPKTGHFSPAGAFRAWQWLYKNGYLKPQRGYR